MGEGTGDRRGISPVIGAVLLVAVVGLLVGVSAVMFVQLTDEREPQPDVVLDMEASEDEPIHRLVHEGGDTLDGNKTRVLGAADEQTLEGEKFTTGTTSQVVPVEDEIRIIYEGEHGTTYRLATLEPESTGPDPDEGCEWVETETDGGTDPIKVDGTVVNCDIETAEGIEVQNGGTVIGDTVSDAKDLDGDDATIYGDADVENVLNLQDGTIAGSATSSTGDVKLDNATVHGAVTAEKVVEVTGGSSVDGDVRSGTKNVKIFSSTVSGSVTADEGVKLDGATVDGEVYIDDSDFDCTDSTINGQDCTAYTPKDPDDW
jgi:flagellin-like protein